MSRNRACGLGGAYESLKARQNTHRIRKITPKDRQDGLKGRDELRAGWEKELKGKKEYLRLGRSLNCKEGRLRDLKMAS